MASIRVLHVERGFRMDVDYAKQVMRDHCSITWVIPGKTIRDTTDEERIELRAQQAEKARISALKQEILGRTVGEVLRNDLPNVRFERPKTTKYRAPREAYEEMEAPLGVLVCRWPRRKAA